MKGASICYDQLSKFSTSAILKNTLPCPVHCNALHCQIKDTAQEEAERLAETVRATFSLEPLPETFHLDETDFVHGLPKVLLFASLS